MKDASTLDRSKGILAKPWSHAKLFVIKRQDAKELISSWNLPKPMEEE